MKMILNGLSTDFKMKTDLIYADPIFNCRGLFAAASVVELAASIQRVGLLSPVIVQPREEAPDTPPQFEYRLISGYRRFAAVTINLGRTEIDAKILTGLVDAEARKVNLQENLNRASLTPAQELTAILRIYGSKPCISAVAIDLGRSEKWVRDRLNIRKLPDEIQTDIAAGLLGAFDIAHLITLDSNDQFALALQLKKAHLEGRSTSSVLKEVGRQKTSRSRTDIQRMMTRMLEESKVPDGFRALAWAAGTLTDKELLNA